MTYPIREHHLPNPQRYAVNQERSRHDDALYAYGEYAMFALMWNIHDHEAGLVDRCPRCYESYGKIAQAYGQPAVNNCPDCFGTSFEGGYKAKIVRPSLWDFNEADHREHNRGEVVIATASIQSTGDFRMRTGDHIFRANGTRWQMRSVGTNHLRTGFEMPSGERTALGYNYGQVSLEDETAVAYSIPPSAAVLAARLDVQNVRYPQEFADLEEIRGPLQ